MRLIVKTAAFTILLALFLILLCIMFLDSLEFQIAGFLVLGALLIIKRGWQKAISDQKVVLPFFITLAVVYVLFGILDVRSSSGDAGSLFYWLGFGIRRILLFANSILIFQNFFAWIGFDDLLRLPFGIGFRKYLILGKTLYANAFSSYNSMNMLQATIPREQRSQKSLKHRFLGRLASVLAMFQALLNDARIKGEAIDNRLAACHGQKTRHASVWFLTVGFTVLVTVATVIIPIPVPGGGFFNFGDVLIVFIGLYAGSKAGAIAGGIGSAIADLMLFPLFAPITLVVKGLEGFICGLAHRKSGLFTFLFPLAGALVLISGYFLGELLMPQFGLTVAVADLPANIVQALVGFFGGRALFEAARYLDL